MSTKIGGWPPRRLRHIVKRIYRARSFDDVRTLRWPSYDAEDRLLEEWWTPEVQAAAIAGAYKQLQGLTTEYLFLHSPPVVIGPAVAAELSMIASRVGLGLGICGPSGAQTKHGSIPDGFKAIQMHLDSILNVGNHDLLQLARRPLWIHGIYTPGPQSRLKDLRHREEACLELARNLSNISLVVGCKSVAGINRFERLSAILDSR